MNETDKAILSPKARYATVEDFTPEWIANQRATVIRDKHKLRAGFPACIEVRGPREWQPLLLPTGGIEFTGKRERDAILAMLQN